MNPFQTIYDKADHALMDGQRDWHTRRDLALMQIRNIASHMLLTQSKKLDVVDQVKSTTVQWIKRLLDELNDTGEYIYPRIVLFKDLSGRIVTGRGKAHVLFSFHHIDFIASAYAYWEREGRR